MIVVRFAIRLLIVFINNKFKLRDCVKWDGVFDVKSGAL